MNLKTFSRVAVAGILGLGLALSVASPADAKPKGRLKDEKRAVKAARRDVRRSDNRFERRAANARLDWARRDLKRERAEIKREDRNRRIFNNRNDRNRWNRTNITPPRNVYGKPYRR